MFLRDDGGKIQHEHNLVRSISGRDFEGIWGQIIDTEYWIVVVTCRPKGTGEI